MGMKRYKSTTNGMRQREVVQYDDVTRSKPEKSLTKRLKKSAGRNNTGRLTVRHRGGGAKRKYRQIDFKRSKQDIPAVVQSIEYDPNRSACIALVAYRDGEKRYIVAPAKLKVGDRILTGESAEIKPGHTLPLSKIPTGSQIHNIELQIKGGAKMVRSAGTYATLLAKHGQYANIKLPSGEVRLVHVSCSATIGQVGNFEHRNQTIGKAGASRWRGRRPTVRGAVMNPCDHPHGGGEGRAPVGRPGPRTPWGKPALGKRTRRNKKTKHIVKRRK